MRDLSPLVITGVAISTGWPSIAVRPKPRCPLRGVETCQSGLGKFSSLAAADL